MPSVTSWTRLEPHNRTPAMTGFAARVGDPLWMLARQWQVGELTGADAGSPTRVDLVATTAVLSRYRAGLPDGTPGEPLDIGVPLESLVEAETATGPADDRAAAVAGADLLARLGSLAEALRADLVAAFPLPAPDPGVAPALARRAELLRRRVPDGRALHAAIAAAAAAGDASTALPGLDRSDVSAVGRARDAASAWLKAWPAGPLTAGAAPPAWRPDRVEYEFAVAASGSRADRVLVADAHPGGPLDWWSLDVDPGATLGAARDATARTVTLSVLPTRVGAAGLPAPRFWAFESGEVNLDAVTAAPEDLARLLFMEFAVLYGNEFYAVPLPVAVGSVTSIDRLTVTTTFGDTVAVPRASDADRAAGRPLLRMFEPSTVDGSDVRAWLTIVPAAVAPLAGEPVEEILLTRDEMANLAWAIERTVAGIDGRASERAEALHRTAGTTEDEDPPGPRYQLVTSVPANWMPMPPSATDASGVARPVLRLSGRPHGRLLAAEAEIRSERLSRAGIKLSRLVQRARTSDGRTVVWMSRRTGSGRQGSSSGLRFDSIVGSRP